MIKVLILGSSGLLGKYLFYELKKNKKISVYNTGLNKRKFDLTKKKQLKKLLVSKKPDLIINSQPLGYALAHSWGLNSLTIGGRLISLNKQKRLFFFRTLMALSNSNIKLKLNINTLTSFKYLIKNLIRISFQAFAQIDSIFIHAQEYNKSIDKFLKKKKEIL